MNKSQDFYGAASEFYDEMINFEALLEKRKAQLSNFIKQEYSSAVDIGCGTGVDSIALSMLGMRVTGFDPSNEMLEKAKKNTLKYSKEINFINSGFNGINKIKEEIDFAVSLGNTTGNVNPGELAKGIKVIYSLLKNGGRLILQQINYENPKFSGSSIINVKNKENETIVRINTSDGKNLGFHILKISRNDPGKNSIISTKIFPHKSNWFKNILQNAGFIKINFFGGLKKNVFDNVNSPNLIIVAEK